MDLRVAASIEGPRRLWALISNLPAEAALRATVADEQDKPKRLSIAQFAAKQQEGSHG